MGERISFESMIPQAVIPDGEVVVALDGSFRRSAHSSAYLSTDGSFGVVAANFSPDRCKPQCSLSTELRAAYYALSSVQTEQVTLLSDSLDTVNWLERWKAGDDRLPSWYRLERSSGQTPTIVKLQALVAERAPGITVDKVIGHSGHLLNDGADILAGIGSNVANRIYDAAEGRRRAIGIAEAYLGLYAKGARSISER